MKVEKGSEVTINYTLKDKEGNVVSDTENQTLVFIQGAKTAFPAIENNVRGMIYNENKTFKMIPSESYGEYYDELVLEIPRSNFPDIQEDTTDDIIWTSEEGEKVRLYIKEIQEDVIIADANHPLSGKELYCDLTITSIKDISPELNEDLTAEKLTITPPTPAQVN